MNPRLPGRQKEPDLSKLGFRDLGIGEFDMRDVEIETTRVGEPELIEGDGKTVIGSDLGDPNFS